MDHKAAKRHAQATHNEFNNLAACYLERTSQLTAEQERHREIQYEWEMACERNRALDHEAENQMNRIQELEDKLKELRAAATASLDANARIDDAFDSMAAEHADAALRKILEE